MGVIEVVLFIHNVEAMSEYKTSLLLFEHFSASSATLWHP